MTSQQVLLENGQKSVLVKVWITIAIVALSIIWLSISFLDGPVANYSERVISLKLPWEAPSSKLICVTLMACCLIVIALCGVTRRVFEWAQVFGFAATSAIASVLLTRIIKRLFGRPFPYNYVHNLRNNFAWHSYDPTHSAFPSTHAALAAAALTIVAIAIPRLRLPSILTLVILNAVLVLGGWHFISDVVAGDLVGFSVALIGIALFQCAMIKGGNKGSNAQ